MNNYYLFNRIKDFLPLLFILAFIAIFIMWPIQAHAAVTTSSANLPWEDPLNKFQESISGPVAYAICIIGIVGSGAALVWGGEIGDFGRKMIMVVLAISVIILASKIMTSLFSSGAVIPVKQESHQQSTTDWQQVYNYLFKLPNFHFTGK